ncbi:hypothetical protein E4U43_005158 [Claviceps pusilla]|uniref:Uncharacterized protein n=1 Tax=Claviceps pusilla TaxID=123648 RepID=A0A9P7NFJ9_9HYPO|nr:hypothetical protein E4U43_005158 [Claviceps pusilla]
MSVAPMTAAPRQVIDLTLDEPVTTALAAGTNASQVSGVNKQQPYLSVVPEAGEPPTKKRRLGPEWAQQERETAKTLVQELLLPHVVRAVDRLSPQLYDVDQIAVEAVTRLLTSTNFLDKTGNTIGVSTLTTPEPSDIENHAALLVQQLAALPKFQNHEIKVEPSPSRPPPQPKSFTPIPAPAQIPAPQPSPKRVWSRPVVQQTKPRTEPAQIRIPKPRVSRRQLLKCQTDASSVASTAASTWLQLQRRPYLKAESRDAIVRGLQGRVALQDFEPLPVAYHVDFTPLEIADIIRRLETAASASFPRTEEALAHLVQKNDVSSIVGNAITGRTVEDIQNFCSDIRAGHSVWRTNPRVLSLKKADPVTRFQNRNTNKISTMLLARELEGNAGFGRMRKYENFQNQFRTCHEDGLSVIAEFTNCAGDITAMCWVPKGNIICGTTTHSDAHNQQYNKPGNLLLCSTTKGTLQAFDDHRIPRPVVEKGENSTNAMRQSQDPWLYSSVVSTDYDGATGRGFTSSFDKTVKVWNMSDGDNKDSMKALATWHHDGNVNFVAAVKDGSGYVATAADVPTEAIRIYTVDPENIQNSHYYTISCTRNDAARSDKWAYFPATMQWGLCPGTQHLLAIGYSPRSLTNDESDIPEDKVHSGEIVLWDAARRVQVPVLTATTANVFEIVWHPTLPRFIVATSPSGLIVEQGTRTNVHVFQLDAEKDCETYSEIQKLDCPASDINELTIMPNSLRHAFVTAACTDGRVYVWDTAQGDRPIHVLKHGNPIDDFIYDREREDTGVKFSAWGTTADRFYTGSSDGVVKVWNVRRKRRPFVRNLVEAPGPISCGIFSPDHCKLAVGDATGRVFLLSVDKRDAFDSHFTTLPGSNRRVRRPQPFTPHAEPPPPPPTTTTSNSTNPSDASRSTGSESIAQYSRQRYLASCQLVLHKNPVIGAIQGPLYATTNLFRADAHAYFDPSGPLLPEFERVQRSTLASSTGFGRRSFRRLKNPADATPAAEWMHAVNLSKDLDVASLPDTLVQELTLSGAQLNLDGEEGWELSYEEMPSSFETLQLAE